MDTEHGPEREHEEYSFMQEIIKDEQLNPRKIAVKVCRWAGIGIIFGVAACISFFALKPWAEDVFQKEPNKVEIQQEEEQNQEEQEKTEQEAAEQQTVEKELTIQDFYTLSNELKKVAAEAGKSVVTVTGIAENADWTAGQGGASVTAAGLIVADNGRELLILADYSSLKDTQLFQVQFADGSQHQAALKQKDTNLDIAIYSVAKDGISTSTWERISIAQLGNSNVSMQGRTMIAIGQPFGFEDGLGYGIASTVGEVVTRADGEYKMIVTDMPLDAEGSGVLFDMYGKVMGIIDADLAREKGASTLVAYGISDITDEIELMSNGKHVPYAGIVGVLVTEEISELQGIPTGLYVREVETDSPAMKAGIQSGDVITMVGDTEITSLNAYHTALYKLEAGQAAKFKGYRYGTNEYVDMKFTVTIGIKE